MLQNEMQQQSKSSKYRYRTPVFNNAGCRHTRVPGVREKRMCTEHRSAVAREIQEIQEIQEMLPKTNFFNNTWFSLHYILLLVFNFYSYFFIATFLK
jgi:hypothetical protein